MVKEMEKLEHVIHFNISVIEGWNALPSLKHFSILSWKTDPVKNISTSAAHSTEASDKGVYKMSEEEKASFIKQLKLFRYCLFAMK